MKGRYNNDDFIYSLWQTVNICILTFKDIYLFFRPEFIEFFGLQVTSSNGSPILTASASQFNNDDDNAAKANDDDMENPLTPVVIYQKHFLYLIFYFNLVGY